jgi:iron complex outermembrane receptor protein
MSMVDGLPVQTNGEFDPINVEKVEVIKGPSATLFGSSVTSFGGLMNIVTKKPVEIAGGEIGYTTGSFGLNRLTADIYSPVNAAKNLLLRVNAAYQYQGSFQDAGFRRSLVIAPSLEYRVNEKMTILLNAGIYQAEMTSPSAVFLNRTRQFVAHTPQELGFDWDKSYTSNDLTMKTPTINVYGQVKYKLSPVWTSQTAFSSNIRKSEGFYQYQFIRGTVADTLLERNISLQNTTNNAIDIQQNFIGDFKIGPLRNRIVAGLDYLNRTAHNNNSPYIVFDNVSGIHNDPNYLKITRTSVEARLAANNDAPLRNYNSGNVYSAYFSDVLNVTDRLLAMISLRVDRFENKGTLNHATRTYVTQHAVQANGRFAQVRPCLPGDQRPAFGFWKLYEWFLQCGPCNPAAGRHFRRFQATASQPARRRYQTRKLPGQAEYDRQLLRYQSRQHHAHRRARARWQELQRHRSEWDAIQPRN